MNHSFYLNSCFDVKWSALVKRALLALLALSTLVPLSTANSQPVSKDSLIRELALARIPVLVDEYGIRYAKARLKSVPRCMFGDLDAIGLEMMASPSAITRLLLSVEGIQQKDEQELSVRPLDITSPVGIESIHRQGYSARLPIPDVKGKPRLLGIFLCKDSTEDRRCRRKAMINIQNVLSDYRTERKRKKGVNPVDKTYYFRFLIVDDREVLFPTRNMSSERYEKLQELLIEMNFKKEDAKELVNQVRNINGTLGSAAPPKRRGRKRSLEIILPRYYKKKCSAELRNAQPNIPQLEPEIKPAEPATGPTTQAPNTRIDTRIGP